MTRTPPDRRVIYVWGGAEAGWYAVRPPKTQPDGGLLDNKSQLEWLRWRRSEYESEGYEVRDGDTLVGPPEGAP